MTQQELLVFLNKPHADNSIALQEAFADECAEAILSVDWQRQTEVLPEVALAIELLLASLTDDKFIQTYRHFSKHRTNINLTKAINGTCGRRFAGYMFKNKALPNPAKV